MSKLTFLLLLNLLTVKSVLAYCSFEQMDCKSANLTDFYQEVFDGIHASDDASDYIIDDRQYVPTLSQDLVWISPSEYLPGQVQVGDSNNNIAIEFFDGRLFVGIRTSKTHFASEATRTYILSSSDGVHWNLELELGVNADIREPLFAVINNKLHFYYFEAGTNPLAFEPQNSFVQIRQGAGQWGVKKQIGEQGEIFWSIKKRFGKLFSTSYVGNHYEVFAPSQVRLHFKQSIDGKTFNDISSGPVYVGGVSEVGFEFDKEQNLWAITRNEDGDLTGFGSHIVYAPKNQWGQWQFPSKSNPRIFMSPKMFRHNGDLYLIARRNLNPVPFQTAANYLPDFLQRLINWGEFTTSAKTTALFKMNFREKRLEHLLDLPGTGDTAFPSIRRIGKDSFLVANYTSPLGNTQRWWIRGQLGKTGIYLIKLYFLPK